MTLDDLNPEIKETIKAIATQHGASHLKGVIK
jgi:hypothetical protein